jgi:protein SCO1/2
MSWFAQSGESRDRRWLLAGLVAVVLGAGGMFITLSVAPGLRSQPQSEAIGGPFTLTAGNGQKLTDHDVRGKWLLMYFGYTHCPDICPTTLAELSETLKVLGPLAMEVQPLFITIDPERDTPDVVGSFVDQFDPRIVGLSGTPAQIAAVAKEYPRLRRGGPPGFRRRYQTSIPPRLQVSLIKAFFDSHGRRERY